MTAQVPVDLVAVALVDVLDGLVEGLGQIMVEIEGQRLAIGFDRVGSKN